MKVYKITLGKKFVLNYNAKNCIKSYLQRPLFRTTENEKKGMRKGGVGHTNFKNKYRKNHGNVGRQLPVSGLGIFIIPVSVSDNHSFF